MEAPRPIIRHAAPSLRKVFFVLAVALVFASLASASDTLPEAELAQPSPVRPTLGDDTASDPVSAQADGAAPDDAEEEEEDELDQLLDMNLEQLGQTNVRTSTVEEFSAGALTEVRTTNTKGGGGGQSIAPAAITTITKDQITASGARNLNELLDIFVPNFQWIQHHWEQSHIGLRGVISDREDKYLLLVNGRIMNDKTHYGAASERELPQLTDIHHIEVVRGPGSAIYGPGAVSMVISIHTDTARTFEGTQFTARQGFVDEFATLEWKHARKWKCAEGGILLYAGIASRDGADQDYAPLVLGTSDPGGSTDVVYSGAVAGQDIQTPINNYGESFDNLLPVKLFADLTYNDWEIWARYTRSGVQFTHSAPTGLNFPDGFGNFIDQIQHDAGNQQVTVHSRYETEVNEDLKMIATLGWDHSEFARTLFFGVADAYAEEELNGRLVFISDLGDHQIAYGGEFYADWFGMDSHLVEEPATIGRLGGTGFDPWSTQTYSLLFEDQWKINDQWTTFLGGRWDKNSYTDWMYSPRAAVVFTPNERTAWKLLLNRSQRMNFAEELRAQWLATGRPSDPEILRSYELRLERSPTDCLTWGLSAFYLDLDAISWNGVTSSSNITGNQTQYGFEAEFMHRHRDWTFGGSHSYVQLDEFELLDPTVQTQITAAPDGFGNDLSNWSDHITKLWIHRRLSCRTSMDLTLRYYWGFPGLRDVQDRINSDTGAFGRTDPGYSRPFHESVFLNLGFEHRIDRHMKVRLDGYNLLGLLQNDLNKRNYYGEAAFRSEAPALALLFELMY